MELEKMKTKKEGIPMLIMKKIIGISKEQYQIWNDFVQEMIISYPRLLLPVINEFFGSNYSQLINVTANEEDEKYSVKIEEKEKMYFIKTEFREEKEQKQKEDIISFIITEKKIQSDKISKTVILYVNYMLFKVEEKIKEENIYYRVCDSVVIKRVQDFFMNEIKKKQLYFFCFMIPIRVYSEMNPYFWSIDADIFANSLMECISILKEAVKDGVLSEKEENVIAKKLEDVCMRIFGQDSVMKEKWENRKQLK